MFAGIGGFRLGLEEANKSSEEGQEWQGQAGLQPNRNDIQRRRNKSDNRCSPRREQGFSCVWANDNDKYACQIYRQHFGEIREGDLRAVDADTIPEHDLLCAGFPCQSFSIAGKRRGFEDTRGTLFFEICRVIWAKRPSYLWLENVKGLLSHDDGRTFETIIGTLDELGYDCQWQVLNSKDFGVPQNRERVFIIGHLRGKPRPKVFPIGEDGEGITEGADEATTVRALQGGGHSGGHHSGMALIFQYGVMGEKNKMWLEDGRENSRNFPQGQRVYSPDGISAQLNDQGGGWGAKTGLYEVPTIRAEHHNTADVHFIPEGSSIRRLTPLECERLQGFPDGWTEGISDTQRYKCLGNAVTVNVIEAIGKQLSSGLKCNEKV